MAVSPETLERNTLRHMAIVGGELHGPGSLCENDKQYRYALLRILTRIGIPLDESFAPYMEFGNDTVGANTEIINIDERWGGRDFLKTDTKTDLLVFANISYRLSSDSDFFDALAKQPEKTLFEQFILSSNRVSDQNRNDRLWFDKVRESGAKLIAVVGECDYPAEKLAGSGYIILRNLMYGFQGVLLHRDYVKDMMPHFIAEKSPLALVAKVATSIVDVVEFRRHAQEIKFEPVFPDFDPEPAPLRAVGGPKPRP